MNWYVETLRKYTEFSGRARRKEYWFFFLFNLLILAGLTLVDTFVGTYDASRQIGLLSGLYCLGVVLPSLAVGVRRLHDIGRTGWWLLISFVPVIGPIVLLIFFILDSQTGDNEYGPNPKGFAP
jgi:uncharacterized membrane protein YhaH (DUF805 family)